LALLRATNELAEVAPARLARVVREIHSNAFTEKLASAPTKLFVMKKCILMKFYHIKNEFFIKVIDRFLYLIILWK
jgi:hypothetical protein